MKRRRPVEDSAASEFLSGICGFLAGLLLLLGLVPVSPEFHSWLHETQDCCPGHHGADHDHAPVTDDDHRCALDYTVGIEHVTPLLLEDPIAFGRSAATIGHDLAHGTKLSRAQARDPPAIFRA